MRYRFDRLVPEVGRLRHSSGATSADEHAYFNTILTQWIAAGELDLLRKLHAGVSMRALLTEPEAALFWPVARHVLHQAQTSKLTLSTYLKSLRALECARIVGAASTFTQVAELPWRTIEGRWGRSAAHWNHLRRCLSRVYSLHLGKYHALRGTLLARMPIRPEPGRMPQLSPEDFWRTVRLAPERFQPYYVILAATGMRLGELLRLVPDDVRPTSVAIRQGKTVASVRTLPVGPEVVAALQQILPIRHSDSWIRQVWNAAREQSGVGQVTLHDLRHCHGQWTLDAGVPDADVQRYLGHATGFMTRRYRMRALQQRNADAIRGVMFTPPEPGRDS